VVSNKDVVGPTTDFPSRKQFLSSICDIEDLVPASLEVYNTDPVTGEALSGVDAVAEADFVHIQAVQMPQEERMQMAMSASDEGKLYTFGRVTRMYAVSGFLVDSNENNHGHLMKSWDVLYEDYFRMTSCLKARRLVRFRWRLTTIYGYLLSNIKGLEASTPSVCMVNFTFLSLYEHDAMRAPVIGISADTNIPGSSSYESLEKLRLAEDVDQTNPRAEITLSAVGRALKQSIVLTPDGRAKKKPIILS